MDFVIDLESYIFKVFLCLSVLLYTGNPETTG